MNGLPTEPGHMFEEMMLDFMDAKYLDGADNGFGEKLKAAVMWRWTEEYGKGGSCGAPRFALAQRGLRKAAPTMGRWPMPEEGAAAIAAGFCLLGHNDMGFKSIADFSTYNRPSETFALRPEDVMQVTCSATPHACLILAPFANHTMGETPKPTKGGDNDQTVILDDKRMPWVEDLYIARADDRAAKQEISMWSFKPGEFRKEWLRACELLGVQNLHLEAYQNRHGGISRDLALRMRTEAEVVSRARWSTMSQLKIYSKSGRIEQFLRKFPKDVIELGRLFLEDPISYLCRQRKLVLSDRLMGRLSNMYKQKFVTGASLDLKRGRAAIAKRVAATRAGGVAEKSRKPIAMKAMRKIAMKAMKAMKARR
jgi:hypothetical protein